jgi:hypothetical protein
MAKENYKKKYTNLINWLRFNHKWILHEYLELVNFEKEGKKKLEK